MSLSNIARNKLSLSSSSNLHRWVLLKNSIIASNAVPPDPDCATPPNSPTSCSTAPTEPEPQGGFMFPRYYSYPDEDAAEDAHTRSSEALWLDTLLESLAHDEEDEVEVEVDADEAPIEEEEDDDDDLLSPMSSSDDLSHPAFMRYYSPPPPPPLPPFSFSHFNDDPSDDDSDPLKSSSCSSSTPSTSPSSSASSLPPATPPSSPLRSWAVPKIPLPTTTPSHPPKPHLYIDAYSDPLPFSHFQSPFVCHLC